jgi:hypothetical protein
MAIFDQLADNTGPREQAITRINHDALTRLQTLVTVALAQPWPIGTIASTAHARIEDTKLYLWMEEDYVVVLECPSIDLAAATVLVGPTQSTPTGRPALR